MLHVRTQFTYHREHNVFQLQNPTSKLYTDKEIIKVFCLPTDALYNLMFF